MSTQYLKEQIPKVPDGEDERMEFEYFLKRSPFQTPDGYLMIAGDGLVSICTKRESENDHHELVTYYHETGKVEPLGALPLNYYYGNFGFVDGGFGCCRHEPGILCQLTPNGDSVVVFGPYECACNIYYPEDAPVLQVYKVSPAELLFERNCQKVPFVKCSPISISICPLSLKQGKYHIAMVTKSMEIRLWDATTSTGTMIQLDSITPFRVYHDSRGNPFESCIRFSPDSRCLCVICYMKNEKMCTCVVLDTQNLDPLCWMRYMDWFMWLRWVFPIFSYCGTEIVWSTYWDDDNKYDLAKSELLFHKIPFPNESLKLLCRVVILKHVQSSSLSKLPLPNDLIQFLADGGTPTIELKEPETTHSCKCSLM